MPREPVQAVVSLAPGETVTRLIVAVALQRGRGTMPVPRATAAGTHVPLPPATLSGSGELLVTMQGEETVVAVQGSPPPWPLSLGWERRVLGRLLGRHVIRWESPSSAG